jgi:hypothetical protein
VRYALLLVLGLACTAAPSAADAEQRYQVHRATIDRVDQTLRTEIGRLPLSTAVRCEDATEVAEANDPERDARFERCFYERNEWRERAIAAWVAFRRTAPLDLLDEHPEVLGIRVTLTTEIGTRDLAVGNTLVARPGTPAEKGLSIDGRKVGWHRYQTGFSFVPEGASEYVHFGDDVLRSGIEVSWSFTAGDAQADVRLVVLMDDRTTAQWREGRRQHGAAGDAP